MSNWISNKLKVAETLLQQIDQQAAESLRKGEKPAANDSRVDAPTKSSGIVPLKDQLKKKSVEENEHLGKLRSDLNRNRSFTNPDNEAKPKPTLTDSDWTELLGPPDQPTNLGSRKIDGKTLGGNLGALKGNRNQKNASNSSLVKSARRSTVSLGRKINGGKPSDGEESASSSSRSSNAELHNDVRNPEGQGQRAKDKEKLNNYEANINQHLEIASLSGGANARSDINIRAKDMDRLRSYARKNHELNAESVASISKSSKRDSSSTSDGETDSSDSGSSSGSESEREREERRRRREKLLAEKAAAKAVEAIKERENVVAKLEGEKQSLDKILEERAKQQAKEASELQTTMMETMEAVEVEKQKHNNTRMEALALLAKLETANADLARSLAAAQKKLEAEIDQVAELRQEIELKEVAHEETKRSISNTHKKGKYLNHLAASKGVEFEREILEAEYSVLNDKILQLQEKAKTFEVNIEMTRKELEDPTEVEIELKRRLGQLTDHLIQKQAQVEALSSEKATLAFRIEAVSRMLDENKSMTGASSRDVESGTWEFSQSKFKPMFEDKIRSGRKHIGSLVLQLDSIFLAGMVFLRRNPTGKLWALVYLVCLHFWVIYIMMSHSQPSDEASGAVFSLENLNNTAG